MTEGNLFGLRRIYREMLGLEIARQHDYKRSFIGLPCDWTGENPIIAPRLGTKSMDSMGSLKITPSRTLCSRQGHHPRSAAGDVASAMVLESVAAGIIVRIASEIREDEERGVPGVFRIFLNGFP